MKDSKYYKKKMLREKEKNKDNDYGWLTRMLLSVIIVLASLIITNLNSDLKAKYISEVLNKNINFGTINNLYKKYIGKDEKKETIDVANINDNDNQIKEKIDNSYKMNVGQEHPVSLLKPGIIVYIGEKDNLGNTVIIQGNDGIDIWYSNIEVTDYSLYDYISAGEILGVNNDDYYILTIMKDGKYLDYDEYFT